MARATDKLKNFEANYAKLEELVQAMNAPELTLKESLDVYEKAVKLADACDSALEYARQRAQALADIHAEQDTEENDL
ncbi:exodeoxyribonuclease VII small subunit [uncultured Megasphaera sp.]|uniref:exodeoxyribonuclease VII small subunit n=1 Tax=uncultured Megasphaera sp. TaxID=165188 RepID=UPI00265ACF80|nr:exodeoxyribonuclease VII small subunit [uncultured Megasphaera sp.]